MTKAERSKIMREMQAYRKVKSGGTNGGRPRSKAKRCNCGAMTAKLAKIKNHNCKEKP